MVDFVVWTLLRRLWSKQLMSGKGMAGSENGADWPSLLTDSVPLRDMYVLTALRVALRCSRADRPTGGIKENLLGDRLTMRNLPRKQKALGSTTHTRARYNNFSSLVKPSDQHILPCLAITKPDIPSSSYLRRHTVDLVITALIL